MKHQYINRPAQNGIALLILALILLISGSAVLLTMVSGNNLKFEQAKKTARVLAEAKAALLGYAITSNLAHFGCGSDCRRPGDLPCPDTNNDGIAETSCGDATGITGQTSRLGRLPWKTLGLDDLRDGNGDRLWYAVSNRFKQNTRAFPLNSNTLGTISIKDSNGAIVQDATGSTGAVAVVISVGLPLTRQDNVVQSRLSANQNNGVHYLDNALGEDNADFFDTGANGFIKGVMHNTTGATILNDQLMVVSQSDMMNATEPLVAAKVVEAASTYFSSYSLYPSPANFSDASCLGTSTINAGFCLPNMAINGGRVPVNPSPDWGSTSILIGISNNNWFQQNGWRELIYYARGTLTLIGSIKPTSTSKNLIVIATGSPIGSQVRQIPADKISEANYLELENLTPLNDTYLRTLQHSNSFNDFPISVP